MKKLLWLILLSVVLFPCGSLAKVPDGAIPFIYDGHLYLKSVLNDSIPVTLIYDTGADFLYLDKDYLDQNSLSEAFGKKGKARMGGAGNGDPQQIEIFITPVKIQLGNLKYANKITPIIALRDILGRYTDGLIGNTHLLSKPLEISFSQSYLRSLRSVPQPMLEGYTRLEARFSDNRIEVKAALQINSANVVNGWFLMDLGSGGSVSLTQETSSSLHIDSLPRAKFSTQAGGIGGGTEEYTLRAETFCMADTLKNLVIDCSLNTKGALSTGRSYKGIIGNEIWSVYDIVIDPVHSSVWVKRNANEASFSHSSTTHMAYVDRTDITDGWIVNGLYQGGIAEKAGIEVGDIIIAINNRPVKEITWAEQREGLGLKGETVFTVKKKDGRIVAYTLNIDKQII